MINRKKSVIAGRRLHDHDEDSLCLRRVGCQGLRRPNRVVPGEVGVFAGILVPDECEAAARPELQAIIDKYKPQTGKLHIADLTPEQQGALRQDVYAAIRKLSLPCFWYAIHVEGLHTWHLAQIKMREETKQAALTVQPTPRVKLGSVRDAPPSMHEELFAGLYGHLVAFLEERAARKCPSRFGPIRSTLPSSKTFRVCETAFEQ